MFGVLVVAFKVACWVMNKLLGFGFVNSVDCAVSFAL